MADVKERPILFNGDMVRAILSGRKTQSRRVVKRNESGRVQLGGKNWHLYDPNAILACPFGQPGDRLWVRETWRVGAWEHCDPLARADCNAIAIDYMADNYPRKEWLEVENDDVFFRIVEQSEEDASTSGLSRGGHGQFTWSPGESPCRLRPSIHMPRWASRITLEITEVRVERLQDISEDDARAEGVEYEDCWTTYRQAFEGLWCKINGSGSWDANPWVWVIEFRRVI